MSIELLTCILITISTLVYVFYLPGKLYMGPEKTRVIYLRERKEAIYENLRDLNFEFKAGKFPDSDYQTMKTSLEEEAAAVLAEIARLEEAAATRHSAAEKEPEFETFTPITGEKDGCPISRVLCEKWGFSCCCGRSLSFPPRRKLLPAQSPTAPPKSPPRATMSSSSV